MDLSRITAFDVETKGNQPLFGLQPFRAQTGDGWITTCAVAHWVEHAALKDVSLLDPLLNIETEGLVRPTFEQIDTWLDAIIAAGQYVVCWNAPFDIAWLIASGHRVKAFKVKWLDGMLFYRHLINAPRFREQGRTPLGLKEAVKVYLSEHAGYEEDIDFDDESPEAVAKLLGYNQLDARFTLWLTGFFIQALPVAVVRCALIEAHSLILAADSLVAGINLNREAAQALAEKLTEVRNLAFVKLKMRFPEDISEEVLASPVQLRQLLFKKWGLPVVHLTETEEASTDKETLLTLGLTDERALMIYEFREAQNNLTKFAQGAVDSLDYNGDGCSRPAFRVFGTYTGRGTYSSKSGRGKAERPTGVAIHQWKRDPEFRRLIEPPPGYDLIECDFAGQEYGWMAVESGDPVMLSMRRPGEDAHSFMGARAMGRQYEVIRAAVLTGDKEAKAIRQFGKVGNLSLQYRTYPKTLVRVAAIQHKMKITEAEATSLRANYLSTYKAVPMYWKRQISKAKQLGYVETLAGRRVQLGHPETWKYADGNDAKWQHESTALNFPIQGVGADQKYLALMVAKDYLLTVDGMFLMELHDGLFFVVPKDKSLRAAHDLKRILSDLPYKRAWGVNLPIDFPVDAKLGPSWGQLEEIH